MCIKDRDRQNAVEYGVDCQTVRMSIRGKNEVAIEPMLTADKAAAVLHMTRRGLYKMIEEGRIRAVKPARRVLISESEIRRLLDQDQGAQGA